MKRKIIVFGNHPIVHDVINQYHAQGDSVVFHEKFSNFDIYAYNEICLLTNPDDFCGESLSSIDNKSIEFLVNVASTFDKTPLGDKCLSCHLLLHSSITMKIVNVSGLPNGINNAFDVHPFLLADSWAQTVLLHFPGIRNMYPMLDRQSIDGDSPKRVHLVICGFDEFAKAMAINAAMIAHFPNYRSEDTRPIRTRITIIDDCIDRKGLSFISEYQHLFDHYLYRLIDANRKVSTLHKPKYHGMRKDFVDIEWEFVKGNSDDLLIRRKIAEWCEDKDQILTIIVSNGEDNKDFNQGTSLPYHVYENKIPVLVRQDSEHHIDAVRRNESYSNIYAFGMAAKGYNVAQPLLEMAKYVCFFYACSYGQEGLPTELPFDRVQEAWKKEKSYIMRLSNVFNAMTISTKIHSLGRDVNDVGNYYALTQEEIKLLAFTEHNRWSVERLIMGVRPCDDKEKEEVRKNISENIAYRKKEHTDDENKPANLKRDWKPFKHFDLCAYEDLEVDETGRPASTYDYDLTACIPLIVSLFHKNNSHDRSQ